MKSKPKKLRLEKIQKSYWRKEVLRDISLEINSGEIVGLLGPNGCGKTTCFYIMIGLIKATAGRVFINSKNITRLPMHSRSKLGLGYLPQDGSIFRDLSVEENILAALEFRKDLNREQRRKELESLLGSFALKKIRLSKGIVLSGGERRRTEIARLLAMNPDFVLLDEPFAGVDPISVGSIKDLVRGLAKRNIGVIVNDHNVADTLKLCDRNYVIGDGVIIASGSAKDIAKNKRVRDTYLGKDFNL